MTTFGDEMLGSWHKRDDLKALDVPNGPFWQMDLPADKARARLTLNQQIADLRRDQAQLAEAVARLNEFVDRWEPDESATPKSLGGLEPELTLEAALRGMHHQQAQTKDVQDTLAHAKTAFMQFVRRVRELTANYAQIETALNGGRIACTIVSWTGDMDSAWQDGVTADQILAHGQNVRIALARRAMIVKLMVVVSTGAVKLSIRLATPGAQLLVLPALWQFVQDVVEQIRLVNAAQSAPRLPANG